MVGNLVLRRRASGAVKRDFRTCIRRYTSPKENFEYGYPHSNGLLQFDLKLERCKPLKVTRHPTKGDVIDDVKLFLTVYRRINCRKFLTISNQTFGYKRKCIRKDNFEQKPPVIWQKFSYLVVKTFMVSTPVTFSLISESVILWLCFKNTICI